MSVIKRLKIWQRFVLFTICVMLILIIFSMLMLIRTNTVNTAYQSVLSNVVKLNQANGLVDETIEELELYLTTNNFRSIESFNRKLDETFKLINTMPVTYSSQKEQIAYNNLRGLLTTWNSQLNICIMWIRGRMPLMAMESFSTVQSIAEQIHETINYLVFNYMAACDDVYTYLSLETKNALQQSIMILLPVILLSLLSAYTFVKELTSPLEVLSRQSLEIATHPEEAHPISIDGENEFAQLANAFNAMDDQIRLYIGELREKADIEKNLRETELKNLSMQNMLNASELKALQSQINPHFLFNTLNSITQLAMLEEADETYELIINVSGMLRYNLRRLDTPVMLSEELENLNRYFYIQKVRYGDSVDFDVQVKDPEILRILIPCLSLQPIVENSMIHGFESSEKKGMIHILCDSDEDNFIIRIEDNGVGMEPEIIERIMRADDEVNRGHSTGIGMRNVMYRLALFYKEDVFDITSELGSGTCVILRIPRGRAMEANGDN